jgi:hypothetical protein
MCGASLQLPESGWARCPRCLSTLESESGKVTRAFPEDSEKSAEIWLPPNGELITVISPLAVKIGMLGGITPEAAKIAADSAVLCWKKLAAMLVRSQAKGDKRLRILIKAGENKLILRANCGGDSLENSVFDSEKEKVIRLDYMPAAQGNLLIIEQSAPEK